MTQHTNPDVYKCFMNAINGNNCAGVRKHFLSDKLDDGDRQWGFYQAVIHNQYDAIQYMLENTAHPQTLLAGVFGNSLNYALQQKEHFAQTTDLLVSYFHHLNEEQQYKTFCIAVESHNEHAAQQMAQQVGCETAYGWLQQHPEWKSALPSIMQKIALEYSLGVNNRGIIATVRKM